MRQFKEDLPPQRSFRRPVSVAVHGYPEDRGPQSHCASVSLWPPHDYNNYFIRSASYESYNDIVRPSQYKLGYETPDCSKVIFTGTRNYRQLLLPKCKRKKCQILKSQFRKRSWPAGRGDDLKFDPTGELDDIASDPENVDHNEDAHRHCGITRDNGQFSKQLGRINSMEEYEISSDDEFWKESARNVVTCYVNTFLAYYTKLIPSGPRCDESKRMKRLIIQVMYNKISVSNHMKRVMASNRIPNHRAYHCTTGGIYGRTNMMINLPRGHFSHESESNSSIDSLEYGDEKSPQNMARPTNWDDDCESNEDYLIDQPPYENFFNESKSCEVGGRRVAIIEGGILRNDQRSSVLTQPRSSVRPDYFYSDIVRVDNSDRSGHTIEDAHCCTSICEMPCKASGIPVYQGKRIQAKKCAVNASSSLDVKNSKPRGGNRKPPVRSCCNAVSSSDQVSSSGDRIGAKGIKSIGSTKTLSHNDSVTSTGGRLEFKLNSKVPSPRPRTRPMELVMDENNQLQSPTKVIKVKKCQPSPRLNSMSTSHQGNKINGGSSNNLTSRSQSFPSPKKITAKTAAIKSDPKFAENKQYKSNCSIYNPEILQTSRFALSKLSASDDSFLEANKIISKKQIRKRDSVHNRGSNAAKGKSNYSERGDRLPRRYLIKSEETISASKITRSSLPKYVTKDGSINALTEMPKKNSNIVEAVNSCSGRCHSQMIVKKATQGKDRRRSLGPKDEKKYNCKISKKMVGQASESIQANSNFLLKEQVSVVEKSPLRETSEAVKNESNLSKNQLIDTIIDNLKTEISKQNVSFLCDIDASKLSKVIDSSLVNNLKIDDKILNNQFHAIITTLQKVAESMDFGWKKPSGNDINHFDHHHPQVDRQPFELNSFNSYSDKNKLENYCNQVKSALTKAQEELNSTEFYNLKMRMNDLTKSQELLNHLEKEYKLLKGEDFLGRTNYPLLNLEAKSVARKFELLFPPSGNDGQEKSTDKLGPIRELKFPVRKKGIFGCTRHVGVQSSTSKLKVPQRSLSLPKSFISYHYGIISTTARSSLVLPDRENYDNSRVTDNQIPILKKPSNNGREEINDSRRGSSGLNGTSFISLSDWDIRSSSSESRSGHAFSQSVCQLEEVLQIDDAGAPYHAYQENKQALLSMPCILSPTNNVTEGMFQKFKKSLSLRINKKISRSEFPEKNLKGEAISNEASKENQVVTFNQSVKIAKNEDSKTNYFRFGHPIFRSSKERKRTKLREIRAAKCSSADSGYSGIEGLNVDGESKKENVVVRRTQSEMSSKCNNNNGGSGPPSKQFDSMHRQSLGRQYSSPQPIKVRPLHRLPNYNSVHLMQKQHRIKRSKASVYLRRSVSQPLDLDKSFQVSLMKIRLNDDGLPNERQRRPSVDNLLNDENTSEDEGALSDTEGYRNETKLCSEEEEDDIVYAEALWDHVSLDNDELVFKSGDLITVVDSSDRDWWWGKISHRSGWFPASFVRLLVNQRDLQNKDEIDESVDNDDKFNLSCFSYDQIRSNVINEILSTEREYVKHLRDVVEGYLTQVRKRPDMFSEESISTIFGNMEDLYYFHTTFLSELEKYIEYDEPHKSCIGECFIQNKLNFEIYSEYCNNHPSAVSELQELYEDQKYVHFFEACRLLQEMIDISLDGFLLTPVQKICKYPLQLQELLKYTRPSHCDFDSVQGAMHAMKEVALLVNERRRRMECLDKIASWQRLVEGWEGPELLDDSSQLIHQGEVTKGVGGSWPKEVTLFLFDHQIIYCKRDLLKRNTFVYRGRINTDLCQVIDIADDPLRSAAFLNAWKIHCLDKNKTYVFTCKTANDKNRWLDAFKKERDLVVLDEVSGFVVSEKQKHMAKIAAKNHNCRPKKPKTPKSHKRTKAMTYAQAKLLVSDIHSSILPPDESYVKKKGLWFSFGANKKTRNSNRNSKISLQI